MGNIYEHDRSLLNMKVGKSSISKKTIWLIAYPIIFGNLAQTLITLTDTAFLGRAAALPWQLHDGWNLLLCLFHLSLGLFNGYSNYRSQKTGRKPAGTYRRHL